MDSIQVNTLLLLLLIAGPVVLGLLALAAPGRVARSAVVTLAAALTAAAGILLATRGSLFAALTVTLAPWTSWAAFGLEALLCLVILIIGLRARNWMICVLAAVQLGLVLSGPFLPATHGESAPQFIIDPLSIILVLVVSVVGAAIVFYALGYMKKHAEHAPATARGNGVFFFFLVGFLGVMNGLVLANDLRWLSAFWEATTLCSFFLIGHDGTDEARRNAQRALLINTFGGAAMVLAGVVMAIHGTESLTGISEMHMAGFAQLAMLLLCLAAFTKSAQMPFQSWLLGAMVAPTPVSALLHSATMVKAGSYLVLRLAPAFAGTTLMTIVAVAGAFTFAATSALAISQSNGKKVLAYSTIANLGLIVTCAGIGTPLAYAAALMILCFHAISKGLLFLCVGTIEQSVGSRDIEDMGGIMRTMPLTTLLALAGMVSMLAPPFAMLLSKWLAIEAAIHSPMILVLLVAGSAFTVLFWAKWIGRIQTVSYHEKYQIEKLPLSMSSMMLVLGIGVLVAGVVAIPLFRGEFAPITKATFPLATLTAQRVLEQAGSLMTLPIFVFLGLALVAWYVSARRFREANVRAPFLCGENVHVEGEPATYMFRGIMDKPDKAWSTSYYLRSLFAEERLTPWANLLAAMILLTLFGVLGVR